MGPGRGRFAPREITWSPGMEDAAGPPVHIQNPSTDPNRGVPVRSLTGLYRGVGGDAERAALSRAIENLDGWITVSSSNVYAGAFDEVENILFIRFNNGLTYYYPASSIHEWMSFLQADSKGKWVWEVLRTGGSNMRLYGILP